MSCITCGATATEMHHIGRRQWGDIVVPVCITCHNVLTIRDCYERKWTSHDPINHVAIGLLDVVELVCQNWELNGLANFARYLILTSQQLAGFRYVPASRLPAYPDTGWNWATLGDQITEMVNAAKGLEKMVTDA